MTEKKVDDKQFDGLLGMLKHNKISVPELQNYTSDKDMIYNLICEYTKYLDVKPTADFDETDESYSTLASKITVYDMLVGELLYHHSQVLKNDGNDSQLIGLISSIKERLIDYGIIHR